MSVVHACPQAGRHELARPSLRAPAEDGASNNSRSRSIMRALLPVSSTLNPNPFLSSGRVHENLRGKTESHTLRYEFLKRAADSQVMGIVALAHPQQDVGVKQPRGTFWHQS
jgi:hypothetical protein